MSFLNQIRSKRLLAIHGWSGIALGVLLYTVVLTGAIAVFAHEIGVWSVGGATNQKELRQPIDAIVRKLSADVDPAYRDDVGVFAIEDGSLSIFFHTHANKESGELSDKGVRFVVDATDGRVISRDEGWSDDVFGRSQSSALRKFLVDLHVQLYVPAPWGLILTGILGLAMMVAAVSGLLLHKHVIKDMFVAPRAGSKLLFARDRHILAGTWGLPFAFLLAFTGSFLSFAFSIGVPIVSMSAFGGDQLKVNEILVGKPAVEDKTPADVTNLDAIVQHGAEHTGATPTFLHVGHYGRADAHVGLFFTPPAGDLSFLQLTYNGITGAFEGAKPGLGTKPSAGASAYTILSALHYGVFGGLFSKIIWVSLGAACCYVILTGMQLWLRRRSDDKAWRGAAKLVPVLSFGIPLAMLLAAHAFFQLLGRADTTYWTPATFFIAVGAILATAWLHPSESGLRCNLMAATALAAGTLPLLRLYGGGRGWSDALAIDAPLVVTVDLLLLLAAVAICAALFRDRIAAAMPQTAPDPQAGPAE